ncbi:D-glycero-beta-D-manno-heptose-7-phosphate kinase [Campylobacter troglodytis]|uniref:D-glycero-beta-D-manno-heptose-7-phosphate kinase n=1 Tax=Campylobacter troglodytis TaxID=654363 RepID=UPI0011588AC8|nr:D-glycero-beta-D-manno-heptose-7-phosphate kinase [Campylobacter troglodytis]TQR60784.1 bifunctional heptose 7-phosphate kinase/heptose 1-phosphate adenyltransferase [Campylobacter troglodytis]
MLDSLAHKSPKVLVIGDLMVDNYIWCECKRVSPEAPVLIMNTKRNDKRLGGAANVYANLKSLGAKAFALSVIGGDEAGRFLEANLNAKLLVQKGRVTSLKNRIISHSQQVLRLDDESVEDIALEDALLVEFDKIAKDYEAIVLSDYGKGVLTQKVCQQIIKRANELKIPVLIDPKGSDYSKYKGATLLTPNKKEAIEALKISNLEGENLKIGIKRLKDELDLKYSLITLSEAGIALFDEDLHIAPAKAREVFDVTGAGDTVIAMLGFCLALKVPILEACELANKAAAVVVSKVGSVTVSFDELKSYEKNGFEFKIKDRDELALLLKNSQKRLVFTNGCFDLLHYGHIKYLEKARNLGDLLVVGLNSDASVKRLKGETRPINSAYQRACLLASLYFVDFVVIFDEDTPFDLIKALKPDILVKGKDYEGKEVVGTELAKEVKLIDFEDGFSTSKIIEKIILNYKKN